MSGNYGGGGGYHGGRAGGGYHGGGGGGGHRNSYGQGGGNGYGRKRGRDDDDGFDQNQRRRPNDYPYGGGGGGGPPRRNYQQHFQPAPIPISPAERFKEDLFSLGDGFDSDGYVSERVLPAAANAIVFQYGKDKDVVFEAFRIVVTEIPHKLAHYVALIAFLQADELARGIVEDLGVAFSQFTHEGRWTAARYIVIFLGQISNLAPELLPAEQLEPFVQYYLDIVEDKDAKVAKRDAAVKALVEVALRGGVKSQSPTVKDKVQAHLASRNVDGELLPISHWQDKLEWLVSTLASESSLPESDPLLASPLSSLPPRGDASTSPAALAAPSTLPQGSPALPSRPLSAGLLETEGVGLPAPSIQPRFFDDDTVPGLYEPAGVLLRGIVDDIINGWEVNRKEAARILLDIKRWCPAGWFTPKPKPNESEDAVEAEPSADKNYWILENVVVECILSALFSLPASPLPSSYYHSLLCEMCRLSPTTVAPALGKCVRKLFNQLGSPDSDLSGGPEGVRRLAEWWSVHLSNFGFLWAWKEWVEDMDTEASHPKRVFVERTIALEVRLSYWDRVRGTIPDAMFDTGVMTAEAPGPKYDYDRPDHDHHAAAQNLLRLIRLKEPIEDVKEELDGFARALVGEGQATSEVEATALDMAVQTILHVGSRSFSHFLNVLERYLPLLKTISGSASARLTLLRSLYSFWSENPHFHLIALDKLLHYRLVDPADVVTWAFDDIDPKGMGWEGFERWEVVKKVLLLVAGRWKAVGRNIKTLERRRVLESKGRAPLPQRDADAPENNGDNEEDAGRPADDDGDAVMELESAATQEQVALSEVASTVASIATNFDQLLSKTDQEDEWSMWWREGWCREFGRLLARTKVITLPAVETALSPLPLRPQALMHQVLDAAKTTVAFE